MTDLPKKSTEDTYSTNVPAKYTTRATVDAVRSVIEAKKPPLDLFCISFVISWKGITIFYILKKCSALGSIEQEKYAVKWR